MYAKNITVTQGTAVVTSESAADVARIENVTATSTLGATTGRNVKMLIGSIVLTITPVAMFLFGNAMSVI